MSSRFFYTNIPVEERPFTDMLAHPKKFQTVPKDWYVVVTDIKNSTDKFDKGLYEEMNIISSSAIVLAINTAKKYKIDIPFIYGGDGATVIVPKKILKEYLGSLVTLRDNALKHFDINFRVGSIQVKDVESHGADIRVAKFLVSSGYTQAVFLGEGLSKAEEIIKHSKRHHSRIESEAGTLNLEGLQCRWEKILAPKHKRDVMCLIIAAQNTKNEHEVFSKVLHDIHEVYGSFRRRHPITRNRFSKALGVRTLMRASYIKYGKLRPLYVLSNFFKALAHSLSIALEFKFILFRHDDYTDQLITATDTLKIDGTLKTIIAGTPSKRATLLKKLKRREKKGQIYFGHHVTKSTTLTCYIHKRDQEYINLIDGTGGGYIKAAKELKAKLKHSS